MGNFLENQEIPYRTIYYSINEVAPDFAFQMSNETSHLVDCNKRGHSQQNAIISYLLDIPLENLVKASQKRRGHFIRIGQLNSPEFLKMASEHASNMLSVWRITKPQRHLYEIFLQFDDSALMEQKLYDGARWKSFDIFSPKLHAWKSLA